MDTITISARINEKKKAEFYHTMESLKSLVNEYCNEIETEINPDNNLVIRITFNSKTDMEKNFSNNEFNILKGTIRSLCDNISYKFGDVSVL
ncbi:MAG: hypothetical protein KAR17_02830 [Cyclobacteriaceae bacterium]|nr:hypothetical protein [Cyclobacteriaceae bacterium]